MAFLVRYINQNDVGMVAAEYCRKPLAMDRLGSCLCVYG